MVTTFPFFVSNVAYRLLLPCSDGDGAYPRTQRRYSRVFKEMKDAGLPEPKIVETAANVTVVLYNGKTANTSDNSSDNHLPENLSVNLSVTQQKILRMIAEKQYINATHAAEILQISRNSVNAVISVLKEKGLIVRIGEDKGGYWEIIKR